MKIAEKDDMQQQDRTAMGRKPVGRRLGAAGVAAGVLGLLLVVQAPALRAETVQDIKALQTIPAGQWQLTSRTEGDATPAKPELGCLTSQVIARDLQELVEVVQGGQMCTVDLSTNTETLGVLELRCTRGGRTVLPAVMEFRREAADRFQVRSHLQLGEQSQQLEQDYLWKGECPQPGE